MGRELRGSGERAEDRNENIGKTEKDSNRQNSQGADPVTERFVWECCVQVVADRLERSLGWDPEGSLQVAEIAIDELRRTYGGKRHYMPAQNGVFRERIIKEFNGRNIVELTRIYGVSASTIRRYLRNPAK